MSYKIAFFTSDWNYETINQFLAGIEQFLRDHEDVSVHVFDNFGKRGKITLEESVFAFLKMPNLDEYDGIVIQGNQSWAGSDRQKIADEAHEKGIPVASINYELNWATYIGTDNFMAMKAMVSHMIEEHQIESLAFIRGFYRSSEAQRREAAFLEACREHHISETQIRLYDGSWAFESGEQVAEEMLKEGSVPEAVICANDDLAAGAAGVFVRHGLRIPEDVKVTGFDNLDIASAFEPSIASVDRDYMMTAYHALEAVYHELTGGGHQERVYSPYQLLTRGSCGCNHAAAENRTFKRMYFQTRQYMKNYYYTQDEMQSQMLEADDIPTVMRIFEQYGTSFGDCEIILMIRQDYLNHPEQAELLNRFEGTMNMMAIIGEEKQNYARDPKTQAYGSCLASDLLPQEIKDHHRFLIFYPLYYQRICIGYLVMNGISAVAEYNFLEIFVMLLNESMESVRRRQLLVKVNQRLDDLYMRDRLTGLYNRFGMERFGLKLFVSMQNRNCSIRFTFVDIDNMKHLNDDFGHDIGDQSIIGVAEKLQEIQKHPDVIAFRYGGDEYLIISRGDDEEVTKAIQDLEQGICLMDRNGREIQVGISIGSYVKTVQQDYNFETCIHQADMVMYECKKQHHWK